MLNAHFHFKISTFSHSHISNFHIFIGKLSNYQIAKLTMFATRMPIKRFVSFLLIVVTASFLLFSSGGCASVVPPSGGPRDSLPPVILEVDPPNLTTNFNSNRITIQFDEYVELENPFQNLLIAPTPKRFPDVRRRLKTLVINLKDTLEENTTYVFNFQDAIKDVNEGNKAKDLLYVFSTGDYFDSLQLSGNIKVARTAKPDSTLTVLLHRNLEDSAVVKERPRYVTRVDSTGTFLFRYLPPGSYRLYALKDESGTFLYNDRTQLFAFSDSVIVLKGGEQHDPVRLYAYAEEEVPPTADAVVDESNRRLKYTTNLQSNKQDLLQALVFTFENPLKSFDSTKLQLTKDSTFTAATGQRFTLDSTRRILILNMPWQESQLYNLVLKRDFAADSAGRQLLKTDTLSFTTKSKEEYGQVRLTFLNLDMSINPVLLLLQNDVVKNAFPLKTDVLELQLINPEEYDMQILHDRNGNGKWDAGEFFTEKRQPEIITILPRKLTVKPNWLTEFEVKMQ